MKTALNLISLFGFLGCGFPSNTPNENINSNTVSFRGMTVAWSFEADRIHFKLSAPTDGWVAIGFNQHEGIQDTYLIMGRVANKRVEVVEHYTLSPGNYQPILELGETEQVRNIRGGAEVGITQLSFSLPLKAKGQYQKDLFQGMEYYLIMAYSQEDDFQHHSIMRKHVPIQL